MGYAHKYVPKTMKINDLSEFLNSAVAFNSNCGFETKLLLLYSVFLKVTGYPKWMFSVNCKEQAVNSTRRRGEKVSRNLSAHITGAILIQATLAFFCRKRVFWKQPYMISMSVGVSTKSADINEREEKLNPSRKPKIFKNAEWTPDTNKIAFASEH